MTPSERNEFERRKKAAEQQLNDMYSGIRQNRSQAVSGQRTAPLSPPEKETCEMENKSAAPRGNEHQTKRNQTAASQQAGAPKVASSGGLNLLQMLNFKGMPLDHDRLVVLALCLLLSSEQADELLLLALIYIML